MSRQNIQKPSTSSKTAQAADWLKPAGACLGLLLLLAGLSLLRKGMGAAPVQQNPADFNTQGLNYYWNLYFTGAKAHRDFITGMVLLGGTVGMIGLGWGFFDPTPPKVAIKPGLFYGIGAALAVFIAFFILHYGMHQIGGYDQSNLVDSSWRLFKGQTAYVDFPYTMPVAYFLGGKFAFQWFGVYWRSFIDMIALFAVPTFAWSLFLLAQLFGRSWTTLLWAMTVQVISLMMAAYWTYNPITAVAAVLYTLSATYWLRFPKDGIALASYGTALLLMATMKPNLAGILIPGISLILFTSPGHRWKVLVVSLAAFALFLVFLAINHLSFTGMLAGYLSVAQRGASLEPFLIDLDPLEKRTAMLILISILLPGVLALSQGRETKRSLGSWIPTFLLLAGLYGYITNSEQKLVDMPPVLCAAILLVAEFRCPVSPTAGPVFQMPVWWNRYFALACVVLGAAGLAQGVARDRIQSIGPVQFFEWDDSRHTIADGLFKGVHCGDVLDEVLKDVTEVLRREPASTVWFGPRMQWGYANFNIESPLHEPVVWDGGRTMYAKSKEEYYFNNFLQSRRQLVILFKNDVTFLSQDEVQRMAQQYDVDQSFPALTVLHLKK